MNFRRINTVHSCEKALDCSIPDLILKIERCCGNCNRKKTTCGYFKDSTEKCYPCSDHYNPTTHPTAWICWNKEDQAS